MIFVTVGTQLPFDRMIRAVDGWAAQNTDEDVFAQIGDATFVPSVMEWTRFLTPDETAVRMREADLIVAHAGVGTIISAVQLQKPIVVFPRRADLGEQRNDHQLATARRFGERGLVRVVEEGEGLSNVLGSPGGLQVAMERDFADMRRLVGFLSVFLRDGFEHDSWENTVL